MDISNNSEFDINDSIIEEVDEFELDKTLLLEYAKDNADELESMLGLKSTISFDASVLTQAVEDEEPPHLATIHTKPDSGIVIEP